MMIVTEDVDIFDRKGENLIYTLFREEYTYTYVETTFEDYVKCWS